MVGITDGLGAYDNGDGTFTVVMNHEIGGSITKGEIAPLGIARAHGNAGALFPVDHRQGHVAGARGPGFATQRTSVFLSNNEPGTASSTPAIMPAAPRSCSGLLLRRPGTDQRIRLDRSSNREHLRHHGPHLPDWRGIWRLRHFRRRRGRGRLGEPRAELGRQWNVVLTDDPNTPG